MPELQGQIGEVRMTVQITRKETGKTETVELVGFLNQDKLKELQDGCHALDGSTQRGD